MGMNYGYKQDPEHVRKRMASKAETVSKKRRPFEKNWLFEMYIIRRLDCVQIGTFTKKDPKTIWYWLKYYGINTRPRGHNVGHLPKGRPPGFKLSENHKQRLREARVLDGSKGLFVNGVHILKGRTGPAAPSWKGGCTPERQAFYSTEAWKNTVKIVWARANAKCERCAIPHNTGDRRGTFHIHHIVSFSVRELRAEPTNLALLCKGCHRFVHSKRNVDRSFIMEATNVGT